MNSVAVSPDGKTVLSVSSDKTLKLWALLSHKVGLTQMSASGTKRTTTLSALRSAFGTK